MASSIFSISFNVLNDFIKNNSTVVSFLLFFNLKFSNFHEIKNKFKLYFIFIIIFLTHKDFLLFFLFYFIFNFF